MDDWKSIFDDMSDMDVLKLAIEAFEEEMASRKDEDFEVNDPQMDKFAAVYRFFAKTAKDNHCIIEPIKYSPKEEVGRISVHFNLLYLTPREIKEFAQIISYTSAIEIFAQVDGSVCVSVNVPNVFKKKQ